MRPRGLNARKISTASHYPDLTDLGHDEAMADYLDEPRYEHNPRGAALVIWMDLGARSSPGDLWRTQALVANLVDAITQAGALQSLARESELGYFLRHREERAYLRNDLLEQAVEEYRPKVAAAGYSNPWWEILEGDPARFIGIGAVAGGIAMSTLAWVDKFLDVLKKARLHNADVNSARASLNRTMLEDELFSEMARQALAVTRSGGDPSRFVRGDTYAQLVGSAPVAGEDVASFARGDAVAGAREEAMPVVSGEGSPVGPGDTRRPRYTHRPSVSGLSDADALRALTSNEIMEACERLIEHRGQDFRSELLSRDEADARLPVAGNLQRALSSFALGDISSGDFGRQVQADVGVADEGQASGSPSTQVPGALERSESGDGQEFEA